MVEFKEDIRDKIPKLIEVNARFWGSLALAISAGIDFPYLLYCMATGQETKIQDKYKVGLKLRWELGDLDHLLIRLKKGCEQIYLRSGTPSRSQSLKNFVLDFFRPSIRNEILRIDDITPFLFEVKEYIKSL